VLLGRRGRRAASGAPDTSLLPRRSMRCLVGGDAPLRQDTGQDPLPALLLCLGDRQRARRSERGGRAAARRPAPVAGRRRPGGWHARWAALSLPLLALCTARWPRHGRLAHGMRRAL